MEDSLDCSVSVTTEHHCSLSFKGCLCFCKFGVDVPLGGGGDLWCGRLQVTLSYVPTWDSFWVSYHCSHNTGNAFLPACPLKISPSAPGYLWGHTPTLMVTLSLQPAFWAKDAQCWFLHMPTFAQKNRSSCQPQANRNTIYSKTF